MKANETELLTFIRNAPQFSIPIYQRNYSWTKSQCRKLYEDILQAGQIDAIKSHFIGSIVYIAKNLSTLTSQETQLVIDGQQRLTSCTLLIAALANFLEREEMCEPLEGFSVEELRGYYLIQQLGKGERFYRLLLSDIDRSTLKALIMNHPMPSDISLRIKENYDLFLSWLEQDKAKLINICKGLEKLMVIDVALERDKDNPQLIFESMNSTGLALSQVDLIRNYILMGLDLDLQIDLYENYWKKMEIIFGQEAYIRHFNDFMRHYLTVKTGVIPNINNVYDSFKLYSVQQFPNMPKDLVIDIYTYATYYSKVALDQESNTELKYVFSRLKALKVDVAYPFLLQLYKEYAVNSLSSTDFVAISKVVASYVFRRAICNIPTNSLNKTFVSLGKNLNINRALNHVKYRFSKMTSYRRFPDNEEFKNAFVIRDVYNFPRRSYLLESLENYSRKELIHSSNYTIEHVLPQNSNVSSEWKNELGPDWQNIKQKYLHTIGNITLTAYNSEFSDRSYTYKRQEAKDKNGKNIGLKFSPLYLNEYFIEAEKWDKDSIEGRASLLAERAIQVWENIVLTDDEYKFFEENTKQSIDFSKYRWSFDTQTLFLSLREKIMELSDNIVEESTKHYIGYTAEKRFVDIIPTEKRLIIVLNIPFDELNEPKNKCRDITHIGSLGNGNVQFFIEHTDDLPYALVLINQSFEWQMEEH
ncbi:hypothetical protein A1D29_03860 [Pasteurellaceae bacterium Orientalotternb1]|nr:hypothetical protein A1D29_03860 [Pasteurellaceae bacterium Orientalotternb1]